MSHATLEMEQRLKGQQSEKCRRAPRFDASAIHTLKRVNRVGGPEVRLINISRGGALIESPEHMSPGSSISLQLVTAETVHVIKGRITRCSNTSTNDRPFQSAIAFDEDFKILPESTSLPKTKIF
jgi:hypothetical protein